MNKNILTATISAILSKGKGILAADETPSNIGKKFEVLHIENSAENRRRYREMLFTAPGIEAYISGVIMQDETINQLNSQGKEFSAALKEKGVLSGIKVDLGVAPFNADSIETITQGLEGLGERLDQYKKHHATFAKWRAVIHIDSLQGKPTIEAIRANVEALAEYALICQQHDIVPIVEPEVLMDGTQTIDVSNQVTRDVLKALFDALNQKGVFLDGILLKPNMVIAGLMCPEQAAAEIVAQKTLECFKDTVPAEIPGVVFLSGGQRDDFAIKHLALMNQTVDLPWVLTFSYGRALQRKALTTWKGQDATVAAAQKAFIEQARLNSLATLGQLA
jgi:fructose-bisphosphate aldolase, class I